MCCFNTSNIENLQLTNGTNCERLEHIQSSATRESKELVAVMSDKVVEDKMEANIVAEDEIQQLNVKAHKYQSMMA